MKTFTNLYYYLYIYEVYNISPAFFYIEITGLFPSRIYFNTAQHTRHTTIYKFILQVSYTLDINTRQHTYSPLYFNYRPAINTPPIR